MYTQVWIDRVRVQRTPAAGLESGTMDGFLPHALGALGSAILRDGSGWLPPLLLLTEPVRTHKNSAPSSCCRVRLALTAQRMRRADHFSAAFVVCAWPSLRSAQKTSYHACGRK